MKPYWDNFIIISYSFFCLYLSLFGSSWGFIAGKSKTSCMHIHYWVRKFQNCVLWRAFLAVETTQKVDEKYKMLTTFIFCESVNSIANRSIPKPQPPVGGNPYSSAVQKVSSKAIASSSPDCRSWFQYKASLAHTSYFWSKF